MTSLDVDTTADEVTDLPVIPAPRSAACPLAPPAEFAAWREAEGLQRATWQGKEVWMISRYQDIKAALVDPRLSANTNAYSVETTADQNMPAIFPRLDDPEHNRLRRMMTRDFTFRRGEAMRPQIQTMVDGFLDDMIATGPPADLVRAFALPVPSTGDLPAARRAVRGSRILPASEHHRTRLEASTEEQKAQSIMTLFGYMTELVARKEREPGDDLISRLVTDHVATGELSRETAAVNGMIMLSAGHETTANMIALGTLALLQHPDDFARLGQTDDPVVIANIVEELMRYLTIVHSLIDRVATRRPHHRRPADPGRRDGADESACRQFRPDLRRPARRSSMPIALPADIWASASACINARTEPCARRNAGCAVAPSRAGYPACTGRPGRAASSSEQQRGLRHDGAAGHLVIVARQASTAE